MLLMVIVKYFPMLNDFHVLLLGLRSLYQVNDKSNVFFRAESNGFRRANPDSIASVFDTVTADYIVNVNDKSKAGL